MATITPEVINQKITELKNMQTKAIQNEAMRGQLLNRRQEIIAALNGMGFASSTPEAMIEELKQHAEQTFKEISELIPSE